MARETVKEVLMRRDGLSAEDADEKIFAAQLAFEEYLDEDNMEAAFIICQEFFGLEPDYLDEFL